MHTNEESVIRQRRRRHSEELKAKVIVACNQPGVSVAAIALANGLNANMVRRWLFEHRKAGSGSTQRQGTIQPLEARAAFVPVKLDEPVAAPDIRIELRRAATTVTVSWPVTAASDCAVWMRELLK